MDAHVGNEIAGFRIESILARGGMGVVYIAEQASPRRKVALKLLAPELASDPAFRQRFIHESEAAASTEHPNIVPIYSSGESDGQLYIAMRYVEGTDLRALIDDEGPLPLDRVTGIVSQVAAALDAAHARGLVHRDVKPSNVLLAQGSVGPDVAYLCDFGLIRRTEIRAGVTKTGQFMGSVDYCAPEQIRGDELDGRADVYSLGCVVYECLTGEPPFRRDTEVASLYAHLNEPPPAPSAMRPELPSGFDVVTKAMAKDPDERYQTAGGLAAALRSAAGGVTAGRTIPAPRRRRRPATWIAAAVIAIVTLVAGGVLATRGDGRRQERTAQAAPPPNSVIEIDPDSGEILHTVTGISIHATCLPARVAVGEGGVWVLAWPDISAVNLRASAIDLVPISLGQGVGEADIEIGGRTVWATSGLSLARINPATGELLRPVRLTTVDGVPVGWTGVSAGEGALWATTLQNQLVQIQPSTARVMKAQILPASTDDVAAGEDGVWVLDKLAGVVLHVDPASGAVVSEIPLGGDLIRVAAGEGSVWVLDSAAGVLTPIDPETDTPDSPIRVGQNPSDLAIGAGTVWVADRDGAIFGVDAVNGRVDRFPVGAPVRAVAVDGETGHVWAVIGGQSLDC
jgi:Protein kinase domain